MLSLSQGARDSSDEVMANYLLDIVILLTAAVVHQVHPDITILVRGHDSEPCRILRKLGANLVVSENLEASLEFAREALLRSDGDAANVDKLILRLCDSHYATGEKEQPQQPG